MKYLIRAMEAAGFLIPWFASAMADGKISVDEMAELVKALARIFKIRVEIEIPEKVQGALLGVTGDGLDRNALLAELGHE